MWATVVVISTLQYGYININVDISTFTFVKIHVNRYHGRILLKEVS